MPKTKKPKASHGNAAERTATVAGAGAASAAESHKHEKRSSGLPAQPGDVSIKEEQGAVALLTHERDALEASVEALEKAILQAETDQKDVMEQATATPQTMEKALEVLNEHIKDYPTSLKAGTPLRAWVEGKQKLTAAKERLESCKAELEKQKGVSYGLAKEKRLKELDKRVKHEVGEWHGLDQDAGQVVAAANLVKTADLAKGVSEVARDTAAMKTLVEAIDDKFDAGSAKDDAMSKKLDAATGKIDATGLKVDAVAAEVSGVTSKVSASALKLDGVDSKVDALRGMNAKIGAIECELGSLKAQVGAMGGTLDDLVSLLRPLGEREAAEAAAKEAAAREAAAREAAAREAATRNAELFLNGSEVIGPEVSDAKKAQLREFVVEAAVAAVGARTARARAGAGASTADGMTARLLYKSEFDDKTAAQFHRLCDNKGMTLVLCRSTTGCVFGGFTTVAWSSSSPGCKAAPGTFLFRLHSAARPSAGAERTGRILLPTQVVQHSTSYGPAFGGCNELYLPAMTSAQIRTSGSGSRTFELPAAYATYGAFLDDTDKPQHNPTLSRMEVWMVMVSN